MERVFQLSNAISNGNRVQPISNQLLLRYKQKKLCSSWEFINYGDRRRRLTNFEVKLYMNKWSEPTFLFACVYLCLWKMGKRKIQITEDYKFEFIKLWEDEDILYEITHDDYRNKNKRNAAIKRIAEEMTVNIDVSNVSKMMKNLRTQFLKEKRKVDDSKSTGKGTKDLYISNWKFYSSLHFLLPFTCPMHFLSLLSTFHIW